MGESNVQKFIIAVVAPLIVSVITAVGVILYQLKPTIAEQQKDISEIKARAVETRAEVAQSKDRQIEIRLQLERMDSKLDQLLTRDKDGTNRTRRSSGGLE